MAVSLKHFLTQIVESGVLSTAELSTFQQAQATAAETAEELAKQLVEQKKLTKYQSQLINQGKGDRLVLGSYVILNVIGVGGMGQVFLAEHRRMKRRVALKTLPPELTGNEQAIRRFHREVQAAAKLTHPNIVTAFDADEDKGIHFFAMEYVSGIDLADNVRSHGVLSVNRAVDYILQAATGLEYAHSKGVIHRDIKPANMLLDHEGTIKILDMGLARVDNAADEKAATALTQAGHMMGTVDYMAPEQARDSHTADARSDIYSLGCTLHYLLTAESVYSGDTLVNRILAHRDHPVPSLTTKLGHVPASLDAVFQKMVAKEPADRYQTVGEVIRDIQACGLLDQSESSATIRTEPVDPALTDFLNSQTEDVTRTLVMGDEAPPTPSRSDTLQSGFLDNTLSGGAPVTGKKSRKSADKRVWMVAGVAMAAMLILVGLFLSRDSAKGTLVLEIDQPELDGAVVSVDGQNRITIQSGDEPKSIEIAADGKQHSLKVTKEGFATFTQQVAVQAGGEQLVKVWLERIVTAQDDKSTVRPVVENSALELLDGSRVDLDVGSLPITQAMTVEAWVLAREPNLGPQITVSPLAVYLSADVKFWRISIKTRRELPISRAGYRLFTADKQAEFDRWTHIAGTWDGQKCTLFINGHPQHQTDVVQDAKPLSADALIGIAGGGLIDELRISSIARYDRDFSPTRRLEADKNTLALYHFEEGQGDVLKDVSGNGHHGTIVGAKWVKVDDELRVIDAPTMSRPQRRAAEMLLARGERFSIFLAAGGSQEVTNLQQLPKERFALYTLNLNRGNPLTAAEWKAFQGVKSLVRLQMLDAPVSPAGFQQLQAIGSLRHLNLDSAQLTDADLVEIAELTDLRDLNVSNNPDITDKACDALLKLTGLRELQITGTSITGAGLKTLSKLPHLFSLQLNLSDGIAAADLAALGSLKSLDTLTLWHGAVDDAVIEHLAKLKTLRVIRFAYSNVSNEGAARLQQLLPQCSILHPASKTAAGDLNAGKWVIENGGSLRIYGGQYIPYRKLPPEPFALKYIDFPSDNPPGSGSQQLAGVRSLETLRWIRLTDADAELVSIGKLTTLRMLNISMSNVTSAGLSHLNEMNHLETLDLSACRQLSDDALLNLTDIKLLRSLTLNQTPVSNEGLAALRNIPNLWDLRLEGCPNITGKGLATLVPPLKLRRLLLIGSPIDDEAIPHLQQMKSLRVLNLTGTRVTAAAAAELQSSLPDCVVFHESLANIPWKTDTGE